MRQSTNKPTRKLTATTLSGAIVVLLVSAVEYRTEFEFRTIEATALVTIVSSIVGYVTEESE